MSLCVVRVSVRCVRVSVRLFVCARVSGCLRLHTSKWMCVGVWVGWVGVRVFMSLCAQLVTHPGMTKH